jgi:peroxiredoxin
MSGIEIGKPAPSLRLPSATGEEFDLGAYRGKQTVLVWFTKGMGCPFCRSQMTQLARGYDDFKKRGAEVLQVTVTPLDRAGLYAKKFKLPFPYLCDPTHAAREEWGLGVRSHSALWWVKSAYQGLVCKKPSNEFGDFAPPPSELPAVLADDDMGFFVVDRDGLVQYALAQAYLLDDGAVRQIPNNEEIERELARCA